MIPDCGGRGTVSFQGPVSSTVSPIEPPHPIPPMFCTLTPWVSKRPFERKVVCLCRKKVDAPSSRRDPVVDL